jgi:DNA polymerase III alpha subunit
LIKYESDDEDDDTSTYDQKIWMLDNIRTEENSELIDLAKRFVGTITGYSKHASAILILDSDIERFCAIERQTDSKTKKPCYVAACAFPLLEAMGLMKADVLGLKTLDVISDCVEMVKDNIDIDKIPLDDKATSDMLCAGRTAACFQIESPGMTKLVKDIRPKCFEDLIPLVALYRPGPLNAIVEPILDQDSEEYIKGKNYETLQHWIKQGNSKESWDQWKSNGGTLTDEDAVEIKKYTMVQTYVKVKNHTELQQWVAHGNEAEAWPLWKDNGGTLTADDVIEPTYLHEKLRSILQNTYSIILYQEQILKIAEELCEYSLGEADNLRRIIGKKKIDEMQPAIEAMIERGVSNGIPREVMDAITKQIVEFASYCFNKAHSAAYGLLSYQTAYLKANYPLEYMCSVINSEEHSHDNILPYIKECKKLGIAVLPPDITKLNRDWIINGSTLRIGLHYIKGIGNNLKLDDVSSFMQVITSNNKGVSTALIKSGALDCFELPRAHMLSLVLQIEQSIYKYSEDIKTNHRKIADITAENESKKDKTTKVYKDNLVKIENRKKDIVKLEAKLAKVYDEQRELEHYDDTIGEIQVLSYSEGIAPNIKVGKLTNVYSKTVSNGKLMGWVTLKSDYGEFRCSAFEEHWNQFKDLIIIGASYMFVCKNTDYGYNLEEISVNGVVYKKPERKWKPR